MFTSWLLLFLFSNLQPLSSALADKGEPYYLPKVAELNWFQPETFLPKSVQLLSSNANVAIHEFQGKLFIGWRNAQWHLPSSTSQMILMSSPDRGKTWRYETHFDFNSDLREPYFVELNNTLHFYFFGGKSGLQFEPQQVWHTVRLATGKWAAPQAIEDKTVPWDYKIIDQKIFRTTYRGGHYKYADDFRAQLGSGKKMPPADLSVFLTYSADGKTWNYVTPLENSNSEAIPIHYGGVSEASFELLPISKSEIPDGILARGYECLGKLVALYRNEDGDYPDGSDKARIGGYVASWLLVKKAGSYFVTDPRRQFTPFIIESSRMFTHRGRLFSVARLVVETFPNSANEETPIPADWNIESRLWIADKLLGRTPPLTLSVGFRKRRTVIYEVDPDTLGLTLVAHLPGTGDNCFPSLVKLNEDSWLLANYTSPLDSHSPFPVMKIPLGESSEISFDYDRTSTKSWSWKKGQALPTQIYLATLQFEPAPFKSFTVKIDRIISHLAKHLSWTEETKKQWLGAAHLAARGNKTAQETFNHWLAIPRSNSPEVLHLFTVLRRTVYAGETR